MVEKNTYQYWILINMFRVLKDINYNLTRSLQNDPSAHSKLEILLLYPHIKALAFHDMGNQNKKYIPDSLITG